MMAFQREALVDRYSWRARCVFPPEVNASHDHGPVFRASEA
jgi:hypothetical protein